MKRLQVWIVSDEKPGHHNQSMGLIQALSSMRELELSQMPIVSKSKTFQMLSFKYCSKKQKENPDLIIGAGHKTHFSLLAYRQCFGGKAIVMMRPSLPFRLFDLCFIPRHDKPSNSAHMIETIGAVNLVIPSKSHLSKNGLILLGGPSKHFNWNVAEVALQLEKLILRNAEMQWTIASSRRTPADSVDIISSYFPKIEFIEPDKVSNNWLPTKMQESGNIWVTEDSVSMIYEALTSGATTGVIRLNTDKTTRVTEEVNRLVFEGRVETLLGDNLKNENKESASSLYEADRCAKLLLEKFDL